jgi:aerotolerance regulator-like protein
VSFERPLALALLAALPLMWWLFRRRSAAPVVRVASLVAFRDAAGAVAASTPRRVFDWKLALLLAAAAALALAAAGPRWGTRAPAAFRVVIDDSASMGATTGDAVERARAALAAAEPGAVADVVPLHGGAVARVAVREIVAPRPDPTLADGLPASLAPLLESARSEGFPGLVLVTDVDVAAFPGVAIVGPSHAARRNLSIAAAALDGDAAVVTVRNWGEDAVEATVAEGDTVAKLRVPPRGIASARLPAPAPGAQASFVLASGDELAADDRLETMRSRGAHRVRFPERERAPRLSAALRASGVAFVDDERDADVVVARGAALSSSGRPQLVLPASSDETEGGREFVPAKNGFLRGDAVIAGAALADLLPAPSTELVAAFRVRAASSAQAVEVLWADAEGALAAAVGNVVFLAIDPEDPRSGWHRDPSFPALVAAALERAGGGPDALVARAPVPASESDVVHDPPRTASVEELRSIVRRDGGPGAESLAPWLAGSAAVLLAAAALALRRD